MVELIVMMIKHNSIDLIFMWYELSDANFMRIIQLWYCIHIVDDLPSFNKS